MVSLRDGKSYDPSTPTTSRPRTRARRSTRSSSAELEVPVTDSEPPTPSTEPSTPLDDPLSKGSKRLRAQLMLEPIADQEQTDTDATDQSLRHAADTQLPGETSPCTPSPLPKKRARTAARTAAAAPASGKGALLPVLAVVLLAIAAAALWPQYGGALRQSAQQALQAADSHFAGLQLKQKLSAAEASIAAASASTLELLRAHTAGAQQHLHMVLAQLHVKYPTLVPEGLINAGGLHATDPSAWAPEVLSSILPDGQQWLELAADMSERLRTPAAQRNHKATAIILACGSSEDCAEAAAALAVLPPRGEACSLVLNASQVAASSGASNEAAAALQAVLAPFLRRCPTGLVLLLEAQQLPVAAVPALHNALSELGGFQHDGVVDGSKAAYALLLQLPVQHVAAAAGAADTSAADASIKEAFFSLQQQLLEQQQDYQEEGAAKAEAWAAVGRALKTLHRRIDFAVPVKLGAAAEDALDLALLAAAAQAEQQQNQEQLQEQEQLAEGEGAQVQ